MKRKHYRELAFFTAILILVLVMLYSGLQILESTVLYSGQEQQSGYASKTITRNGVAYFPRQDITTVLVLGIDQLGPVEESEYYFNSGAADLNILLTFDEVNKTCSVLHLNRDSMVTMPVLGMGGREAGTDYAQLALAHTYGTGLADSCENVKNTLMNFIHGLTVDYYVAMNMDAIPILNDAVGGVTVNVTDDFSQVNPSITMGELTLRGDQVIDYVRTRKDVGDQKNVTRMQRQKEYVDGFLDALMEKQAEGNVDFALRLYEQLAPYVVTDCSSATLSGMLDRYVDFTLTGAVTPTGENLVENGHYAFYVDEEELDRMILDLFYREK